MGGQYSTTRTSQFMMRHLFTQCGWMRCGLLTVEEMGIILQLINLDRFANFYISEELIDAALKSVQEERKMFVENIIPSTFGGTNKEWSETRPISMDGEY